MKDSNSKKEGKQEYYNSEYTRTFFTVNQKDSPKNQDKKHDQMMPSLFRNDTRMEAFEKTVNFLVYLFPLYFLIRFY